ncbi:sugar phosphate nucleotidyltransferase [Cohnella algarum]|uniref:sugar phosphate nucleotidyltransferase n=1 Tax=Cohnella algarum TaxID=2044859 RepID=UPI001F08142B|nr:sugar phosphate nucleotidyltransferase [Cohnella algarum]
MKLVLLSGGSGKRLWPLSSDSRSKQFLKVLGGADEPKISMIQRVWGQLKNVGLADSTFIATSKSQVEMIHSQLDSEVPLIVEPERRDTFPAVALAAAYLHSVQKAGPDETVIVLPVDPYVDEAYFERLKLLDEALNRSEAELALMGVKPTFPSEKYGYIVPDESGDERAIPDLRSQENVSVRSELRFGDSRPAAGSPTGVSTVRPHAPYASVSRFQEKPSQAKAAELIAEGALWNCGVFAFKLGKLMDILREKEMPLDFAELARHYKRLPKISFDYEVVEKSSRIVVVPYEGEWKDLGTWNTLTEELSEHLTGKGKIDAQSANTHVVNELDIPIVALGLRNVVVAASPDGILVSDKDASPRIKDVVDFVRRPMYEERRWGWYKILDYAVTDDEYEVLTKRVGIAAGKNLSYHYHGKRNEVWTIIKGTGDFALEGKIRRVAAGDVLHIPVGARHGIRAIADLEFIEVQNGSEIIDEDIVRLHTDWDEILKRYVK